MPQVAVDEVFPKVPATKPAAPKPTTVTVSTSAAGLKLASENSDAYVATLGVEVAAGSQVETEATAGLSQLFAKMAFRATETRSDLRLYRDIEAIGGSIQTSAGRDFVRYNISVLPDQVEAAAEILAETTLAPRFAHWDIDQQKNQVRAELELLAENSSASLLEAVHGAAFYDDVTLGRPIVSADNLAKFDTEELVSFYEQYVNSANVALVGAGVDHNTLTDLANDFFATLPKGAAAKATAPVYVGGETRIKSNAAATYVALGFKTAGKNSAAFGASQVLKALLTSRLGSKKAAGFLASYESVGVVGLAGYAAPAQAGALVESFVAEIKKVAAAAPSAEELAAAKTVAAIDALNATATRQGRVAALGAQAFAQKAAVSSAVLVDSVSAKAVQELAQQALASRPSLASIGKVSAVPRLDAVVSKLQ